MNSQDGRRNSDVLDAILDKVARDPARSGPAVNLFRAKALDQLDISDEVDTRLPLVSRRSWLALVGVGLLVMAFALWAALTPSITGVRAPGRVMAAPGAMPVASAVDGYVESVVDPGTLVTRGAVVATVTLGSEILDVTSMAEGTVWQTIAVPGEVVRAGQPVVTLLPPGSAQEVLLVVPEADAVGITSGMTAQVAALGVAAGTVEAISGPMSAEQAGQRTGSVYQATTSYVLVTVGLTGSLEPGAAATATVVLSEGTVLTRLLGRT